MTNHVLASASELGRLEFLWLHNSAVTDEGVAHLTNLENLIGLGIFSAPQVRGDGLKCIPRSVERLYLEDISVSDDALKHIASLMNFRELDMRWEDLPDEGLALLGAMPWLCQLSIRECRVGDDAIATLIRGRRFTI
jgi:hypothetical protein